MNIDKILELIGAVSAENGYQEYIELWESWLKGEVEDFHSYTEWNGYKNSTRERMTLSMAKKSCEEWADMLYNPDTEITVDESYQDCFDELMTLTDFAKGINNGIERGYGLGTLGIVTSIVDGKPTVDFTTADMMYPVYLDEDFAWCIVSEYKPNLFFIQLHMEEIDGKHIVHNRLVKKVEDEYELLTDETLRTDYRVEPIIEYPLPMLNIITPAISNNIDTTTPYGISIFANALSELKGVDIAYTGIQLDITTGKRITFSTVDNLENHDGNMKFPDTEGFYVMEGDSTFNDGSTVMFKEPTLKGKDLIDYLETNLNMFGRKVGFGDNAYSFQNGSVYTNTTQVISTNSKMFKTRNKHLVIIREALEGFVRAIYYLDTGNEYTGDITVEFDDSIVHDIEKEEKELVFQLMNGLISEVYYWQVKLGLTEDLAIQFVKEQQRLRGLIEMPEEEGGEE